MGHKGRLDSNGLKFYIGTIKREKKKTELIAMPSPEKQKQGVQESGAN